MINAWLELSLISSHLKVPVTMENCHMLEYVIQINFIPKVPLTRPDWSLYFVQEKTLQLKPTKKRVKLYNNSKNHCPNFCFLHTFNKCYLPKFEKKGVIPKMSGTKVMFWKTLSQELFLSCPYYRPT